jgi:cell division septum initiation protein DivIVA
MIVELREELKNFASEKLYSEVKELLEENLEMREIVTDMKKEIEYGKQRENKLMFFLFLLKERGFPITDIFEKEIKNI